MSIARSASYAVVTILTLTPSAFRAATLPDSHDLADVLRRAGDYVARYGEGLAVVVARERYTQRARREPVVQVAMRRLESDFVWVRPSDATEWLGLRDVYLVDERPVRDRDQRLARLLAGASGAALARARTIADEGARYNLGSISRNFNQPTTALALLQPGAQPRVKYRRDGEEKIGSTPVLVVRFEERKRPTLIRTQSGAPVFLEGRLWIAPATGEVWRTELRFKDVPLPASKAVLDAQRGRSTSGDAAWLVWDRTVLRKTSGHVTVDYAMDAKLEMLVPVEMRESYEINVPVERIAGTATYDEYRRFETSGRLVP